MTGRRRVGTASDAIPVQSHENGWDSDSQHLHDIRYAHFALHLIHGALPPLQQNSSAIRGDSALGGQIY